MRQRVLVIAHRGAHRDHPENGLAAIRRAIELGCDYVELDVRQTRDGALVLMHDAEVDRTTDGRGKVAALSLAELRGLTLDGGGRVPTFAEALRACRGRIGVYVDHKGGPPAEVVRALEAEGMIESAVVYGGGEQLREFRRLAPTLRLLAPHPKGAAALRRVRGEDPRPELLDSHVRGWTVDEVRLAHELGAEVWVDAQHEWDCEEGYRVAVAMGVDALQTDEPQALLELLRRLGRR
ncbi:MAG: glycerophosphodiester phosphodiesterase family protein [Planctomycetota bacterium]